MESKQFLEEFQVQKKAIWQSSEFSGQRRYRTFRFYPYLKLFSE